MVKQIVRDVFFLGQPSEPATKADIQVGKDLQDTLQANRERCVGMAANMIGVKKNIILYCGLCLRLPPHSCIIKMLSMATSFQKFRIWKENVLEELYRKYQGKTIKDDYGKNSKEFIDFANDMKKSMKINAAKYGLRLITFETGHYDMCGYFNII